MAFRHGMVFLIPALFAAGAVVETPVRGQAVAPARVDPYQGGAAPAFPRKGPAAITPRSAGVDYGIAGPVIIDPVGMNYYYATGIPMTRGQVGLSAVSSLQQMTGLGSGRLSGVRGGDAVENPRRSATRVRNANVPGGQASGFFNRLGPSIPTSVAATPSASDSGRFYGRHDRYFPRPAR